uniref:Putative secreted protein n=1 Tax=Anopheles darlingi TaxID=43151 RepID=A0A2M4D5Q2_ANODA
MFFVRTIIAAFWWWCVGDRPCLPRVIVCASVGVPSARHHQDIRTPKEKTQIVKNCFPAVEAVRQAGRLASASSTLYFTVVVCQCVFETHTPICATSSCRLAH